MTLDEIHYNFLRNTKSVKKSDLESSHPYNSSSTTPKEIPVAPKEILTVPHTLAQSSPPDGGPQEQYGFTPEKFTVNTPAKKKVKAPKLFSKYAPNRQKVPADWDHSVPPKIESAPVPEPSEKDEAHMGLKDLLPRVHKQRYLEHHHFHKLPDHEKEEHVSESANPFKHFNEKENKVLRRDLNKIVFARVKQLPAIKKLMNTEGSGFTLEHEIPEVVEKIIQEMGPSLQLNEKGEKAKEEGKLESTPYTHEYHKGYDWNTRESVIPDFQMIDTWANRVLLEKRKFGELTGHKEYEKQSVKARSVKSAKEELDVHKLAVGIGGVLDDPIKNQDGSYTYSISDHSGNKIAEAPTMKDLRDKIESVGGLKQAGVQKEGVYEVPDLNNVTTMQNMKDVATGIGAVFNQLVQNQNGGYTYSISDHSGNKIAEAPTMIGLREQLVNMGKLKEISQNPYDQYDVAHGELLGHTKKADELGSKFEALKHDISRLTPEDIDGEIQKHKANAQQNGSDVYDIVETLDKATDLTKSQKDVIRYILQRLTVAVDGIEDQDQDETEHNLNLAEKRITSLVLPEKYNDVLTELKIKTYKMSKDIKSMQELADPKLDLKLDDLFDQKDAIEAELNPSLDNVKQIQDKLKKLESGLPGIGKYKELKDEISKKEEKLAELAAQQKGIKTVSTDHKTDDGENLDVSDLQQSKDYNKDDEYENSDETQNSLEDETPESGEEALSFDDGLQEKDQDIGDHWKEDQVLDGIYNKNHQDYQPPNAAAMQKLVQKGSFSTLFGSDGNPNGLVHVANDRMIKYVEDGDFTNRLEELIKQFSKKNGANHDDIPKWLHAAKTGAKGDTAQRKWKFIVGLVEPSQEQIKEEMKNGATEEEASKNVARMNANKVVITALQFSKYHVNPQTREDVLSREEEFEELNSLIRRKKPKINKKNDVDEETLDQNAKKVLGEADGFDPLKALGDALVDDNPYVSHEDRKMFDFIADSNRHYGGGGSLAGPGTLRRKGERKIDFMHGLFYHTPPDSIDWNSHIGGDIETEEAAKQAWRKKVKQWYHEKQKAVGVEEPEPLIFDEESNPEETDPKELTPAEQIAKLEKEQEDDMGYKSFVFIDKKNEGVKFIFKG